MIDLFEGKNQEIKIGEHGIVRLVDSMPRLVDPNENWDHAVCQAARTSYGNSEAKKSDKENRGLIRYLLRNHHGTPFEMVDVKVYMALPIFVARQLIRHRTASVNEYSMRYKEPKDEFFFPDLENVRKQSKNNKQGSDGQVESEIAEKFIKDTQDTALCSMDHYIKDVDQGIGKEIARINLPLNLFTYWYWEIDLRNLLGFLRLRMDSHAQKEIRDYANALYDLCKPLAPWTFEAYEDYMLNSLTLSGPEIEKIKNNDLYKPMENKREQEEFEVKLTKLGLLQKKEIQDAIIDHCRESSKQFKELGLK